MGNARGRESGQFGARVLDRSHVVVIAAAGTGSAATAALVFASMAALVGPAFILALLAGVVIVLIQANTVGELARWYPSAGSFYEFGVRAFGERLGFLLGWLTVGAYVFLAAASFVLFGAWVRASLNEIGLFTPWWIWSAAAFVGAVSLTVRGIRATARVLIVLFVTQLLVLGLLTAVIYTTAPTGTYSGQTLLPESLGGFGFAVVIAVLACRGFEEAATVAEETTFKARDLRYALLLGALVATGTYLIAGVGLLVGLGPDGVGLIQPDSAPIDDLAAVYLAEPGSVGITLAMLAGFLALGQGALSAGSRVGFAMARAGALPSLLSRIHVRHGTPYLAAYTIAGLSVVLGVPFGFILGARNLWMYAAAAVAVLFLVVYTSANVAISVLANRRREFDWVRHAVLPGVAALVMVFALFRVVSEPTVAAVPSALAAAGWLVVGIGVLWLSGRWTRGRTESSDRDHRPSGPGQAPVTAERRASPMAERTDHEAQQPPRR